MVKHQFKTHIESTLAVIGHLYTELAYLQPDNYALQKADDFREHTDKIYLKLIFPEEKELPIDCLGCPIMEEIKKNEVDS